MRPSSRVADGSLGDVVGDDVTRFVVVPWMHEYALVVIASCCTGLRDLAYAEATIRVRQRRYDMVPGMAVTPGFLARLERDEEHARLIRQQFQKACSEQVARIEMVSLLTDLYKLHPLVLSRPDAIPKVLVTDRVTRAWFLHILPTVGEEHCVRELQSIREATLDRDACIRSAALLALRAATRKFSSAELEAHAEAFARGLGHECESTRRAALSSMQRFSPGKIGQYEAELRQIILDDAEADRIKLLARRVLELGALPMPE